jgi:hypothetical protein
MTAARTVQVVTLPVKLRCLRLLGFHVAHQPKLRSPETLTSSWRR